jgi:hypothetical protein
MITCREQAAHLGARPMARQRQQFRAEERTPSRRREGRGLVLQSAITPSPSGSTATTPSKTCKSQGIANEIPCEWYGERMDLESLVDCLLKRRRIVRRLIEDFRQLSRNLFPNWAMSSNTHTAAESNIRTDPTPWNRFF